MRKTIEDFGKELSFIFVLSRCRSEADQLKILQYPDEACKAFYGEKV